MPHRGPQGALVAVPDPAGDGTIATNAAGEITGIDLAASRLLGWTAAEAVGRRLDDVFRLVDPETGRRVPTGLDDALRWGRVVSQPLYPALLARDGRAAAVVSTSVAPILGGDGAAVGAMLAFRDQARQRRHAEALEASEARTWAILEGSFDAVVSVDATGRLTEFNAAAEQMFAYTRTEVLGQPFAELLPPGPTRVGVHELLGKRHELEALRSDGAIFWVELAVVRIPAAAVSFTCFLRDLTVQKHAEAALTRSHAQLRALAGRVQAATEDERTRIARELHDELGQQLTAIRMDLGWLVRRRKLLPPDMAERVDAVAALVETTFQVVRRLGTELRPGILDDLGLTAAIAWQAREFETRSGIRVDVDAEELVGLDPRCATAVFRIFQEILTNVGRHSGARRVTARLAEADGVLRFDVTDDGRGIRPEEAVNLNSLGLLGMRERAALLGGTFDIRPGTDRGTAVAVTLPTHSGTPS